MPGWMGMRGLVPKSVHDMERERREDQRPGRADDLERRALEKVQEVLRDQQGDMSAFTGGGEAVPPGADGNVRACPVERIMSSKVAVLAFDDNLLAVQGIFAAVKFRHLPVVDDNGCIIGIVSDRDVLRVASPFYGTVNEQNRDKEIMARKIGTIMTRGPVCVHLDTTVLGAIRMMNGKKISCLPVVHPESRKLFGIVTWKDIVRAFCPEGFNRASDSQRLKTGVKVRAESADTTRVIPKPEQPGGTRVRPRIAYDEEVSVASQRLAARVRAARERGGENGGDAAIPFMPPEPPERPEGDGDTRIIPQPKPGSSSLDDPAE